jgi:hypothetical protein
MASPAKPRNSLNRNWPHPFLNVGDMYDLRPGVLGGGACAGVAPAGERGGTLFACLVSDGESEAARVSVSASTTADPWPGQ